MQLGPRIKLHRFAKPRPPMHERRRSPIIGRGGGWRWMVFCLERDVVVFCSCFLGLERVHGKGHPLRKNDVMVLSSIFSWHKRKQTHSRLPYAHLDPTPPSLPAPVNEKYAHHFVVKHEPRQQQSHLADQELPKVSSLTNGNTSPAPNSTTRQLKRCLKNGFQQIQISVQSPFPPSGHLNSGHRLCFVWPRNGERHLDESKLFKASSSISCSDAYLPLHKPFIERELLSSSI